MGAESELGQGTRIWFTVRLQRGHGALPVPLESTHVDASDHRLFAGARVLLAEDNSINREVALDLLRGFGVEAVAAHDGQAAVNLARAETFDLILMDVHMPVLDGLSATREIRTFPGYAAVPILALTANVFEDDRRACLEAGMDGFVPKPVSPPELRKAMAEALRSGQVRRIAVRGTTDATPRPTDSTTTASHHGMPAPLRWPGLDPSVAVGTVGGPEGLVRILNRLFTYNENVVRELEAHLAADDIEAATFRAHQLKGAAGTLGAVALQRAAATLERTLREGTHDPALLSERVAVVARELEDLGRRLAQVRDEGSAT